MYCKSCIQWRRVGGYTEACALYGPDAGHCRSEKFQSRTLGLGGFVHWNRSETGSGFICHADFGCVHHEYDNDIEEL